MPDQANGLLSPWLRQQRISAARPYWRGRILDFGCGIGRLADLMVPEAYVGLDTDADSLSDARRLHPQHRFASAWPNDETFDTVVALAVIEHLPEPEDFLRQAAQALAPGGRIVLTTPAPSVEWVHTAGSWLGLFSHHASEEHEHLLDRAAIMEAARAAGLRLEVFRSFLFGGNQLAVLVKSS